MRKQCVTIEGTKEMINEEQVRLTITMGEL